MSIHAEAEATPSVLQDLAPGIVELHDVCTLEVLGHIY